MSRNRARTIRLITVAIAAVATIGIANWRATAYLAPPSDDNDPYLRRSDHVRFLAHDPSSLPAPLPHPQFLLMGNSHTYTLPGINRGEGLRIGAMWSRPVLLDDLVNCLEPGGPKLGAYDVLAYPNFLPYEMLTRAAQLYIQGYRPDLVVLGITWRNIARDSRLRYEVRQLYRDPGFADAFSKMLDDPAVRAGPQVLSAIAADARQIKADEEQQRVQSDADKLDGTLTDWIKERLMLLGGSGSLRARVQLDYINPLQDALGEQVHKSYEYDVVEHDYQFNLTCLRALLRLLRSRGSQVVCYMAPERTDVPPLMDPAGEQEFYERLQHEAAALGVIVLDARHVVPNEYWGWDYNSPDGSHFTEPGHERLAQFLADEIERRHLWPPQPHSHAR